MVTRFDRLALSQLSCGDGKNRNFMANRIKVPLLHLISIEFRIGSGTRYHISAQKEGGHRDRDPVSKPIEIHITFQFGTVEAKFNFNSEFKHQQLNQVVEKYSIPVELSIAVSRNAAIEIYKINIIQL